nr:lysophospholipid acyltransferase family protein [Marinicella sp. W31]MDC2876441.1 lysophospholipid acyltransferase family protein [Marinicella sp. W31]
MAALCLCGACPVSRHGGARSLQIIALWRGWALARRMPRYWHMVACFVLGIRIHVHGGIETRRPLMLSSNHTSWLDIIVLGRVADVAFIAKSEVRSWPIFGLFARLQNSVFIERADRRGTGRQVNSIAERLAGGEIIILFPEGTTSDGNRLLPLKYSLFGAASSAVPFSPDGTVYVQPVALAYTGIHGLPMGRFMRSIVSWPGMSICSLRLPASSRRAHWTLMSVSATA